MDKETGGIVGVAAKVGEMSALTMKTSHVKPKGVQKIEEMRVLTMKKSSAKPKSVKEIVKL